MARNKYNWCYLELKSGIHICYEPYSPQLWTKLKAHYGDEMVRCYGPEAAGNF